MYEDNYHTGDITYEDFEIRKGHNEWLSDLVADGNSIKMPQSKYGEPYLVYSLSEDGPYTPNAITEGSYYVVAVVDASENYDRIYTQPVLVINDQSETKDDDEEIAQKESPKEFDPNDKNKDGVVSCDELLGEGWIWDESVKACIYPSSIIPNTGTK